MKSLIPLYATAAARLDRAADWLLPTLARFLFAAILLIYFWKSALTKLGELNERQARVVVYRAFGAMTDAEIAHSLGVSVPTVRRDYRVATAWLRRELVP